ncbi:hypothetical protein M6D81_03600 [Paenibacillus sp. J5C_2022]|uniref:hypothetical protein n=1 Tax=Paenibacillus sp. J5C2022 TaxID=2977129 RepID=UPI0021D3C242|nr:hypothetical protein [Paenibacillus sp. J5C2022]MCU6707786.1 hypothetical protein [Paenibacillus sp. J5C2022]
MRIAKVGVLLDRRDAGRRQRLGLNVFGFYLTEVLQHAGIPFDLYEDLSFAEGKSPDLLLVAHSSEDTGTADELWAYAERGGTLIAYGSLDALAVRCGCEAVGEIGPGYAKLDEPVGGSGQALRFLAAKPWRIAANHQPAPTIQSAGVLCGQSPDGPEAGAALQRMAIGKGTLERWSVSLPDTIVMLQQGQLPVICDGVPAPDGTAQIHDGFLKADDEYAVDWTNDRERSAAGEPFFAHPYADLWREALVSHLLRAALALGLPLPFIDRWPASVEHVALLSLDSDSSGDMEAETTLELLEACDVPATWCMIAPLYSREIFQRMLNKGHEIAFHYNAVTEEDGEWTQEAFGEQLQALSQSVPADRIFSNKNHMTRLEGWGELFRWCEQYGIASDQTRGGSKRGNTGFLYGTCQPYFPAAWCDERNRTYDVLEIGFLYSDFLQCDPSLIAPILEQTSLVRGIAHFVFHPIHIHRKPAIYDWLRQFVQEARQRGFVFWTGERINEWERQRRKLRIESADGPEQRMIVHGDGPADACLCIPLLNGEDRGETVTIRYGVNCKLVSLGDKDIEFK